jgi:aarF domain-containing kinase
VIFVVTLLLFHMNFLRPLIVRLFVGNLLLLNKPTASGAKLALIDCGLVASIDPRDRDNMISALIHLSNKDFPALVDDFVNLGVLPSDCNRAAVIPLMDKALSPYIKGGGAKRYEEEVMKMYGMEKGSSMQNKAGGFQAMTQDALTVLNDIPFSIPPYFALLGRAIVTLEGVALSGDPNYAIIRSSYPFVARKLLREGRPQIQKALQEVLYSSSADGSTGLKLTRLLSLLNNAAGNSGANEPGAAFVDLDAIPEDGALTFSQALKYLLSDDAEGLRNLLEKEVDGIVDVISRQVFRRAVSEALVALTPPRPPSVPFLGDVFPQPPALDEIPLPIPLPGRVSANGFNRPTVGVLTIKEFTDTVAPRLNPDEDVFAIGLAEAAEEFFGEDVRDLIKGKRVLSRQSVQVVLQAVRSGLLGRNDLLSSDSAKALLRFVDDALQATRQGQRRSTLEHDLMETATALDDTEKERLDDIVEELTRRAISRAVKRLATVERIG